MVSGPTFLADEGNSVRGNDGPSGTVDGGRPGLRSVVGVGEEVGGLFRQRFCVGIEQGRGCRSGSCYRFLSHTVDSDWVLLVVGSGYPSHRATRSGVWCRSA